MIFPALPEGAHAEEPATATPRAIEDPTVSLTVPATIEFADVMATPSGATTTASAKIGVTTTASAGYKLYLYAEDNSLKSLNPNTTQSIASASASSLDSFTNNTWGYNLTEGTTASTTYSALPTTNTTPTQTKDTSTTNSANDTYTLSLGAKVDSTIPSGTYTSTLTISVVAEPRKLTLSDISNMQDMTPEICAASSENETKRLIDARDQKLYWVAKLADNQCWMTQNLDLDLSTETALTPNDSDVSANWTPTMSTQTTLTSGDFSDDNGVRSFDPGMYVNNNPTAWTSCNSYWNGGPCDNWTNVSSMTAMTEERTDGTIIDGNTYDAHYLAGNYYQWNAATAGTGGSDVATRYQDATGSICPKGWKLPSRGNSNSTNDFYGLTSAYSISSDSTGTTALTKSPLYFIPAGRVASGSLDSAGNDGYYGSSTARSSTTTYGFSFTSDRVASSSYGNRYVGRSVRCLAR